MPLAATAQQLHPLFQGLLRRHLENGGKDLDCGLAARLLLSVPLPEVEELLDAVNEAFLSVDRELGQAALALDSSMDDSRIRTMAIDEAGAFARSYLSKYALGLSGRVVQCERKQPEFSAPTI